MRTGAFRHFTDPQLVHRLASLTAQERVTTAALLAHLAEVDARRLYLPAAYPSMYAYCVHELHLSEDAAYRRITAARLAREFPAILDEIADGRLHLSGVGLLAPHLTAGTAAGLLAAAAHKTKSEIEALIAGRFPRTEELGLMQALAASGSQLVPERVKSCETKLVPERVDSHAACANELAPGSIATRSKLSPIAHERFMLQFTFVSESGHRCAARKFLEFDHIQELARGGRATVAGIRLRCRGHNQYGAERTFGVDFMRHKREMARREVAVRRRENEARPADETCRREMEARAADEARRAAEVQAADEARRA